MPGKEFVVENALMFELMARARADELRRFASAAALAARRQAAAPAAHRSAGLRSLLARLLLTLALRMDRAAAISRLSTP